MIQTPPSVLRAHPRAGGENAATRPLRASMTGSSPRGRGKLSWTTRNTSPRGLIPARAGKTEAGLPASGAFRAHPRAGGENRGVTMHALRHSGSSPRGRGKLVSSACEEANTGLIPARAGKTFGLGSTGRSEWAHPRAGGENRFSTREEMRFRGSSPRGRGKHAQGRQRRPEAGLIPARAGKTRPVESCPDGARAHPRAGGENRARRTST